MLRRFKLQGDEACNGEVAVEKVQLRYNNCEVCKGYKLIIMDVDMPLKNGYEASLEIKKFIEQK